VGSIADRVAEQRRAKLEAIERQIAAGSLTVRKMTPEERKLLPPPVNPRRK
jgi:phosphoribosylaminoimidazole-succinocarboxamide synthase